MDYSTLFLWLVIKIVSLRGYQRKYIKFVYVTSARWCSRQSHCCYAWTIIYERDSYVIFFQTLKKISINDKTLHIVLRFCKHCS